MLLFMLTMYKTTHCLYNARSIILQEHTIPYVAYKHMYIYTFVTFYDAITQYVKTLVVDNQIEITKSHMPMFISNLSNVLTI